MSQKSEIDKLEQFVSKLLNQYDQLREKNTELQTLLHQKDEEIADLKAELSDVDSERGDISKRVKGLIDQIEEWESALSEKQESEESTIPEKTSDAPEAEEDAEQPDEAKGESEKDGGLQRNLFNVGPRSNENLSG